MEIKSKISPRFFWIYNVMWSHLFMKVILKWYLSSCTNTQGFHSVCPSNQSPDYDVAVDLLAKTIYGSVEMVTP